MILQRWKNGIKKWEWQVILYEKSYFDSKNNTSQTIIAYIL